MKKSNRPLGWVINSWSLSEFINQFAGWIDSYSCIGKYSVVILHEQIDELAPWLINHLAIWSKQFNRSSIHSTQSWNYQLMNINSWVFDQTIVCSSEPIAHSTNHLLADSFVNLSLRFLCSSTPRRCDRDGRWSASCRSRLGRSSWQYVVSWHDTMLSKRRTMARDSRRLPSAVRSALSMLKTSFGSPWFSPGMRCMRGSFLLHNSSIPLRSFSPFRYIRSYTRW